MKYAKFGVVVCNASMLDWLGEDIHQQIWAKSAKFELPDI